jgi:monoamine oxidase
LCGVFRCLGTIVALAVGLDVLAVSAVDWNKIPYNLGPWIHWTNSGSDADAYRLLNQPEGHVYFSGAHLSQLPTWQEGAVLWHIARSN